LEKVLLINGETTMPKRGRKPDPARILITVPHGCNPSRDPEQFYCDVYAKEVGEQLATNLRNLGYPVQFLYTDAFRGVVDANREESQLKHLPSGSELARRQKQLKKQGVNLSHVEMLQEELKAVSFRNQVNEIVHSPKPPHVHIDLHSFGGCPTYDVGFGCKDVAVFDIIFYGKDDKMHKNLLENLKNSPFSSVSIEGSRANDVIVSEGVENSVLVEFNRNLIQKVTPPIIAEKFTPLIDQTIQEVTEREPKEDYRDKLMEEYDSLGVLVESIPIANGVNHSSNGNGKKVLNARESAIKKMNSIKSWLEAS
jgi:hypothetical protein